MTKNKAFEELNEMIKDFRDNMTADENGMPWDEREKTVAEIDRDEKSAVRAEEIIDLLNNDEKDFVSDIVWSGITSYINFGHKINALKYIGM